jgi:hypothetical protein
MTVDDLVLRYLAAFGPASAQDAQRWCGLVGLATVFARLKDKLVTFRGPRGILYDLPDAPRPDPATEAPVRYLAPFDNLLLSHVDRTRVIDDESRRRVFTVNGIVKGTILVDGVVRGTWDTARDRDKATLTVTPFARLSTKDKTGLAAEGQRLLEFAESTVDTRDVVIAPPTS